MFPVPCKYGKSNVFKLKKKYLLSILFSFSQFWVKQWLYWLSKLIGLKGKIHPENDSNVLTVSAALRILVCLPHSSILTEFAEGTLMTWGIYLYMSLFSYLWLAGFHSHDYVPQVSVFLHLVEASNPKCKIGRGGNSLYQPYDSKLFNKVVHDPHSTSLLGINIDDVIIVWPAAMKCQDTGSEILTKIGGNNRIFCFSFLSFHVFSFFD